MNLVAPSEDVKICAFALSKLLPENYKINKNNSNFRHLSQQEKDEKLIISLLLKHSTYFSIGNFFVNQSTVITESNMPSFQNFPLSAIFFLLILKRQNHPYIIKTFLKPKTNKTSIFIFLYKPVTELYTKNFIDDILN